MKTTDITALVTGGASGLGLATTEALVRAGAHVGILDLPGSPGKSVAEQHAGSVTFLPGDVTSSDDVSQALDVLSEQGPLRVVVNCAGVGPPGKVLGKNGPLPMEDFERIVRINLFGTFNVIRLAAERIASTESVDGERGVIVNTASVAAFDGQIGQPAYAASKGAIVSMALPIARELARHQIRVATIAPGIFDTPLLKTLPDDARASLGAQVPHPSRLGDPDEFGALVRHIVENPMLNGEVIRLDGAIRMAPR
ncbi:3-hydroxyacyl-CoA dehydrogenase [Rhodococcus sp. BP-252]|uniref:3-hydroxy-2-methylbutyryl-CoA dehydrogenase n=1 Tax=Rhodococcoides kyotonense TaxID=398843 RepID=A0A177YMQ4_9NOCA|nr:MULTISPECIES: 3-hydroxyacyl-CoA dehydrogenase [Rhodococcus]MBY6414445.1 3-hydroxyacyl-CoA dehydrogenase [Rhodococcus sp. BP-320]MBY6419162.1 3-hydroxyacyl-CoA dehydrogenase [Rhodococcus sp. BP-321]MBY6424006.1 3-hydroxyacyl-CoA dehydrogenase [Rhodococcus sp. BP-324]MBY6429283.1 3-hydroxyacyl-CoA dehydrogenase [Rhodococcus sp. BP-323]MBY6434244.1 3-hydroxyacyl-CoA dehydrogenase [Rhodococcus sp. BP-322]